MIFQESRAELFFNNRSRIFSTGSALDLGLSYADLDPIGHGIIVGGPEYGLPVNEDPLGSFCLDLPATFDPCAPLSAPTTQFDSLQPYSSNQSSPENNAIDGSEFVMWETGPSKFTPPLVKHSMETLLRVLKVRSYSSLHDAQLIKKDLAKVVGKRLPEPAHVPFYPYTSDFYFVADGTLRCNNEHVGEPEQRYI